MSRMRCRFAAMMAARTRISHGRQVEIQGNDYDVFDPETRERVGYARLRWGRYRVFHPDFGGELVLEEKMEDEFAGLFLHGEREEAL